MKKKFSLDLDSLSAEDANTLTEALLKSQESRKDSCMNTYHESNIKPLLNKPIELRQIKIEKQE